jgi:sn-glycerol 3-phosphate transport system substrate-binding protein
MKRFLLFFLSMFLMNVNYAQEIQFWHSFSGHLGYLLKQISTDFNNSQDTYKIKPVYKGNYAESLTSLAAAFRAGLAPPLVQVFEVGTATMLYPKGVIKPLYEIMYGQDFDKNDIQAAIYDYYSDNKGRLLALPFNTSVPVLYYNKSLFDELGILEVGKSWEELEQIGEKIIKNGRKCAYTSAYPSWVHLEVFSMIHGLSFTSGRTLKATVAYNKPEVRSHIKRLVRWKKRRIFEYGGRDSDPASLFISGHCAMFTQSSGSYKSLQQTVKFELGVAAMPYSKKIIQQRHNSIIGGAAIWVMNGFDEKTYRGVAHFLSYLSSPKVQAYWQKNTGYMAISKKALAINRTQKLPIDSIAADELTFGKKNHRIRLGGYAQIRRINDEELEAAFAEIKSVEQALDDAVKRVNHLLRRFNKNNASWS